MTQDTQEPDALNATETDPETGENILLNWIIVIAGFGAIALIGVYLPSWL
jgi:hypothetical protein